MSEHPSAQPNQPGNNPREIRVAGTDRIYDRNKLLIVLLVPLLMTLLQVSSVNNALPSISASLGASDSQLQWVLSGYALAFGITLVPAGRLGDVMGRSSIFVIGFAIFTIASLLVGLMQSATTLNMMRILQGFGSGLLSPQTTGLIQRYFTGQARAKAFSLFGLVVSMSVAAGPVMSGGLIALLGPELGWRASFIINFPIGIIGIILAIKWLPFGKERRHVGPHKDDAKREYVERGLKEGNLPPRRTRIDLDPIGMVILAVAIMCIMLPFMTKDQPWVWALLAVGVVLTITWFFWEKRYKARGREPMVDLDLFKIKTFSYSAAVTTVLFMGTTSLFVILAIYLQDGQGASALTVGLIGLPNALLSGYAAIWSGKRAVEHGRGVQVMSLAFVLAGVLGMTFVIWGVEHGLSYYWLIAPTLLMGFGLGALGSANQTQSMLDVPAEHGGTAGGVMQTGQRIAAAVGNAVITAIFFLGLSTYSGESGYYFGAIVAYIIVCVIITIALVIAILFWRDGYSERHPESIKPARKVLTEAPKDNPMNTELGSID